MTDSETPLTPDTWSFSDQPVDNGYSFKTKVMTTGIVVVALVFSIVAFLYLYVRYALYRRNLNDQRGPMINIFSFRVSVSATEAAEGEPPSSGLEPSTIAALPTFQYRYDEKKDDVEAGGGGAAAETDCAVCLSVVEEGEKVRQLPGCKHLFHTGCIDIWLSSRSTCPICRMVVKPLSSVAAQDVSEPLTP